MEEGDANTHFFHLSSIIYRSHNNIPFLFNASNKWVSSWEDIGNCFLDFYQNLLTSSNPNFHEDLSNIITPCNSPSENASLCETHSPHIIKNTLFTMKIGKSPDQMVSSTLFSKIIEPFLLQSYFCCPIFFPKWPSP